MTAKRQTESNPFIKPDSPYRCSEAECFERGVWSPGLFGSGWFCAKHAVKLQAVMSEPDAGPYLAFCQWWAKFKRNPPSCEYADYVASFARIGAVMVLQVPDFETAEERAAIQHEADPL